MKFLKLITLLLLINNFAFSAEIDQKKQNEEGKSEESVLKIFGKKVIQVVKHQDSNSIAYYATLEDMSKLKCTKFSNPAEIQYTYKLPDGKEQIIIDEDQFYFDTLEYFYKKQSELEKGAQEVEVVPSYNSDEWTLKNLELIAKKDEKFTFKII